MEVEEVAAFAAAAVVVAELEVALAAAEALVRVWFSSHAVEVGLPEHLQGRTWDRSSETPVVPAV